MFQIGLPEFNDRDRKFMELNGEEYFQLEEPEIIDENL